MKRLKWTFIQAFTSGLGLAIAWVIIAFFLDPRPLNDALIAILIAFSVGFIINFPLYYVRFPVKKEIIKKAHEQDLGQ